MSNNPIVNAPVETARPAPQRRAIRGFSLMELLIYLALAAVFVSGILTLAGQAGLDDEVRQAVQDISAIDNAMRGYYGVQRIATASAPLPAQMEAVVADKLEGLADPARPGQIFTQFGTDIGFTAPRSGAATVYRWPNYWISYTGMRTETCSSLLAALSGPIGVMIEDPTTAVTSWTVGDDHREDAMDTSTNVDAWCTANTGTAETYTVHALFRI